ncbi:MAG TPA: methyltransferase [Mucilaginibacter sp.]|nr:methyltransferase [Mucilaginibacter sp.]
MSGLFRFKQFSVDQTSCAMKINTDGVLLGAIAGEGSPVSVLDIGTGTGVIALMLAQRFKGAMIDAVEIDVRAAETAAFNFRNSPFKERLKIYPMSFAGFCDDHSEKRYDLIVSNPPFYINSLESPESKRTLAKHSASGFFEELITGVSVMLSESGKCWLILPPKTATDVKPMAAVNGLYLHQQINIKSFAGSKPHREILCMGFNDPSGMKAQEFVIYDSPGVYTAAYKELLAPYFLNF